MSDEQYAAVTYDGLPASSGGAHSLGRMTRRAALEATTSFRQTCTEPAGPTEYSITVHQVPGLTPPTRLLHELERRFGRGRLLVLAEDEVEEALDLLDDIHPQPTNQWGMAPIWFSAGSRYRLLDPQTGRPLPGQTDDLFHRVGYTNESRLVLDNSARLALSFCIPGGEVGVLDRMIPWLEEHLPCKLSPKQWRAWTRTRSGTLRPRVLGVSAARSRR
ncbi:hypothetical protein ACT8ZV_10305 [Nocardioides sp. MAHUQ-72]|uniref:hypothetical protein n=1 Tax=unclassified Nocardioides TaxID=2615069 RepID=UPI00361BE140